MVGGKEGPGLARRWLAREERGNNFAGRAGRGSLPSRGVTGPGWPEMEQPPVPELFGRPGRLSHHHGSGNGKRHDLA